MVFHLSTQPHFYYHGSTVGSITVENVDDLLSEWEEIRYLTEGVGDQATCKVIFENVSAIDGVAAVKIRHFLRKLTIECFVLRSLQGPVADLVVGGIILLLSGLSRLEIMSCVFDQPEMTLATLFQFTMVSLDTLIIDDATIPGMILSEWYSMNYPLELSNLSLTNVFISGSEMMEHSDIRYRFRGSLMRIELRNISCENPANLDALFDAITGLPELIELQIEEVQMTGIHSDRLLCSNFTSTLDILYLTRCNDVMTEDEAVQFFIGLRDYHFES